jgi:hypothetical protein
MNGSGMIIDMSHVSKESIKESAITTQAGIATKSLGKVAHCNSYQYLRDSIKVWFFVYCLMQICCVSYGLRN